MPSRPWTRLKEGWRRQAQGFRGRLPGARAPQAETGLGHPARKRTFRGLTPTLVISFLTVCTAVLLIYGGIGMYVNLKHQQSAIFEQQQLIAQNAANRVNGFIQEKFSILEKAVSLGNLAEISPGGQTLILEKLLGREPPFRQLSLLDYQHRERLNISRLPQRASGGLLARTDENFQHQMTLKKNFIGQVYVDEVTSEPMIIMAVPLLTILGDVKGALLAEVNLKFIWELMDSVKIGKTGSAFVIDKQGRLIAFKDLGRVLKREDVSALAEVRGFMSGASAAHPLQVRLVRGIQGRWVVSNHAHLNMPDWAVVVELPANEAYQSILQKLQLSAAAMLLILGLAILFSIYLSRKITLPVIQLRDATRELAQGNWNAKIKLSAQNEIGELAESFNQMVEALQNTTVSRDSLLREIGEREKLEAALMESEEEFRLSFERATDAIIWADTETGTIIKCNRAAEKLLEKSTSEIVGHPNTSLHPPEKAEYYQHHIGNHIAQKGAVDDEAEIITKSGRIIPVQISASVVAIRGKPVIQGIFRDIHERKLAEKEKERLQTQLLQAQKLESIGQLAAGIAHEINTPTQYVGDNLRFLQEALDGIKYLNTGYTSLIAAAHRGAITPDALAELEEAVNKADLDYLTSEVPKAIQQSLEGVERVTSIVRAMKSFAHPGSAEKSHVNLNEAIQSTITVARNEWKYVADLVTDFDTALPPVLCFPGEFNQVILNLIVNAAHAIGDVVGEGQKGKIIISTRHLDLAVEIRISDTGTGIPADILPKIFDPFFTTKKVGKGTGQGLALTHSVIVKKHGGSIDVETQVGKGTTFILRLPLGLPAPALP